MQVESDDAYEEIACGLQCALIATLDTVLKKNGLESALREKVVEECMVSVGKIIDQRWVESAEGKHFPIICFSQKHWEDDPDQLIYNNGMFSWAEYASGNCHWYYEENSGDPSSVVSGMVGEE